MSRSYRVMKELADSGDAKISGRLETLHRRAPEEFYDLNVDPWELDNRIGIAAERTRIEAARSHLYRWMEQVGDPLRTSFAERVGV